MLPALGPTAGLAMVAVPVAVSGLPATGVKPPGGSPIMVTVAENSSPTVIDLSPAFGTMSGIRPATGLKLSILGNTNSGLVKPTLSEASLSLTYVRGKSGTATVTVCATDRDGVSVKQALLVTVSPLPTAPTTLSPTTPRQVVVAPPAPR